MSEIIVDAEKVIMALDKVEEAMTDLRAVLTPGVFHKKVPRTQRNQPPQDTSAPMILDLDLSKVPFKIKGGPIRLHLPEKQRRGTLAFKRRTCECH